MESIKVEQKTGEPVQESTTAQTAALPDTSRTSLRDELKKDVSATPSDSIEIVAGETTVDPQKLMSMFLMGKLTQGQLSHELKKYNDVVADTLIKEGKQAPTKVIDYRDVGRASIANPGGDLKHDDEQKKHAPPPKNAKEARKEAGDADNEKKKKELQRQEQKMKTEESLTTLRRLNNFTEAQTEQKNSHAWRELKRHEEENKETRMLDEDPKKTSIDKALTRSQAKDQLRSRINEEIRRELDKSISGPGQSSGSNKR